MVAQLRDDRGLSQMDLAVATGYSLRYIGDIERGTKSATLRTLNDISTLLGLGLGELISRAERLMTDSSKRPQSR